MEDKEGRAPTPTPSRAPTSRLSLILYIAFPPLCVCVSSSLSLGKSQKCVQFYIPQVRSDHHCPPSPPDLPHLYLFPPSPLPSRAPTARDTCSPFPSLTSGCERCHAETQRAASRSRTRPHHPPRLFLSIHPDPTPQTARNRNTQTFRPTDTQETTPPMFSRPIERHLLRAQDKKKQTQI